MSHRCNDELETLVRQPIADEDEALARLGRPLPTGLRMALYECRDCGKRVLIFGEGVL